MADLSRACFVFLTRNYHRFFPLLFTIFLGILLRYFSVMNYHGYKRNKAT